MGVWMCGLVCLSGLEEPEGRGCLEHFQVAGSWEERAAEEAACVC